jgi:hypothetical protein
MMFWLIFIAIMAKFTVIPPHRCAEPNPPYQGPASAIEAQDPPPPRCAEPNPPYQGPASVIEAQDPPRAGLIDP